MHSMILVIFHPCHLKLSFIVHGSSAMAISPHAGHKVKSVTRHHKRKLFKTTLLNIQCSHTLCHFVHVKIKLL